MNLENTEELVEPSETDKAAEDKGIENTPKKKRKKRRK